MKIIYRELKRLCLILLFPILLPLWVLVANKKGSVKGKVIFYWKSVFKKDLNLKE